MESWIGKVIASLLFFIDQAIYGIVSLIYNWLIEISEVTIFKPETIARFGRNIYVLLGIFMLFKVSISLITYVVNPDSFSDKEKGVGNLIKNSFLMLILLILTPWIFNQAYELQGIILRDNTLGNIILGVSSARENSSGNNVDINERNAGKQMAYLSFTAFFNVDIERYPDCEVLIGAYFDDDTTKAASCENAIGSENYKKFKDAKDTNTLDPIFDHSLIWAKNSNGEPIIKYHYIIATAGGVIIVLILLNFCFDIAMRSVKFGFLQLIAPIPIISVIDPKSSKSGMFSKWVKECTKTYLDLFIRLAAIYFAIFIIGEVANGALYNVINEGEKVSFMPRIFIILGALMFAKKLPDLISDLTGVKLSGSFSLNPMKKVAESPFAAAAVGGVAGALGGMAANTFGMVANFQRKKKEGLTGKEMAFGKQNFFGDATTFGGKLKEGWGSFRYLTSNTFGSIVAGGASSAYRAARGGLTSGGKGNVGNLVKSSIKQSSQARNLRDSGYGFDDKIIENLRDVAQVKNDYGTTNQIKGNIKWYKQQLENVKQQEQAIIQQQNLIASQNPEKAAAYIEANRLSWENLEPGQSPKYVYEDYNDYLTKVQEALKTAKDDIERAKYSSMLKLSSDEFNRIRALDIDREYYDEQGKKIEKKIKSLEEDMYKAGKKE